MNALSVSDFRCKMSESLNKVAEGEIVYIRRNNQLFAVVAVDDDDLTITPSLQKKIDRAHEQCVKGECKTFNSASDAQKLMYEL